MAMQSAKRMVGLLGAAVAATAGLAAAAQASQAGAAAVCPAIDPPNVTLEADASGQNYLSIFVKYGCGSPASYNISVNLVRVFDGGEAFVDANTNQGVLPEPFLAKDTLGCQSSANTTYEVDWYVTINGASEQFTQGYTFPCFLPGPGQAVTSQSEAPTAQDA